MADEENIEEGAPEETQPVEEVAAEEVQEEASEAPAKSRRMLAPVGKVKPDVWTALLVVAFCAFLTGIVLAGNELHDYYDVQFWLFSKK